MLALLVAAQLATTTPAPGVDCSLLTRQQATGLVCAIPPKADPPAPEPAEADCAQPLDPYAEPDRAARCAMWMRRSIPRPTLPVYEVGAEYAHAYDSIRMVVLGVGASLEGVPVVTGQFTAGIGIVGQVFAFRVDQGQPWHKR